MATTNDAISNLALAPEEQLNGSEASTSIALVTDKSTIRGYWKLFPSKELNAEGKPVSYELKIQAKAESAKKDNWKKLEEAGWTLLNENDAIRYICKSEEAVAQLIAESEQRVYMAQAGINYVSNSKINSFMVEIKEGTGTSPENPPIAVHNSEEYDLRAPLNEKPGRKSMTQMEKLEKMLEAMGLSKEQRVQFLRTAAASYEAAKAAGAVPAEEEGEVPEEGEEEEPVTA